MNNFHPKEYDLINLYEVTDEQGVALWGGEKIEDMFDWYWRSPEGARVFISAWNSNDEDAHMVGRPIEVTAIVGSKVGEGK